MNQLAGPLPGTVRDPLYPESDGEPMGETGYHVKAILLLYQVLQNYFQNQPDVYVAADMFLYYKRGKPSACKAPDVMVAKGLVGNHERLSFRTWEEGTVPRVIFEITSAKTKENDQKVKPAVYAKIGVAEYFLFDPLWDYLDPPLQGFQLRDGKYRKIIPASDGSLLSRELGLRLSIDGSMIRLTVERTGERLLNFEEKAALAWEQAEKARRIAKQRSKRAEQESRRAQDATKRAAALEAEVKRLRAELDRAKNKKNSNS